MPGIAFSPRSHIRLLRPLSSSKEGTDKDEKCSSLDVLTIDFQILLLETLEDLTKQPEIMLSERVGLYGVPQISIIRSFIDFRLSLRSAF
mgnify:CR=1 FL=1